jgi:hypothetical protein
MQTPTYAPIDDRDLRPDRSQDAHLWRAVFLHTPVDLDPCSAFGALRSFRTFGADLLLIDGRIIMAPGEMADTYAHYRHTYLMPHRTQLEEIFAAAASSITAEQGALPLAQTA